jgi:two-component system, NarL family, nitrate/nitrite response regulator NarL
VGDEVVPAPAPERSELDRAGAAELIVVAGVRLYREGIAHALRRGGYRVAGMAGDERGALLLLGACSPAVALVDVNSCADVKTVRRLRQRAPQMRIVVLAIRDAAAEVLTWAEAGIAGYVTIEDSLERLVDVVGAAVRGEAICTPAVSGALFAHVHRLASGRTAPGVIATLTTREREIAQCLCDGLSNKEIAARLVIALPTVKNHVHHILAKLEVAHRAEAVDALSVALR